MNKSLIPMLLFLMAGSSVGQGQEAPSARDPAEVQLLIDQLSAPNYQVREDATLALWELGESAQPLVDRHVNHVDPETRARIQYIRNMLSLGLAPDTPEEIGVWVRQVQSGSSQASIKRSRKFDWCREIPNTDGADC